MNEELEIRVLSKIMLPKGKPIFSESAITYSRRTIGTVNRPAII